MDRFTLSLEPEFKANLEARAKYNRRSLNQEVVYLLECALAAEIEVNLNMLRTLMIANGGPEPINPTAE